MMIVTDGGDGCDIIVTDGCDIVTSDGGGCDKSGPILDAI